MFYMTMSATAEETGNPTAVLGNCLQCIGNRSLKGTGH